MSNEPEIPNLTEETIETNEEIIQKVESNVEILPTGTDSTKVNDDQATTNTNTDVKPEPKKSTPIPNPKSFVEFQEMFKSELETIRSEDATLRFDAMIMLRKYLMPGIPIFTHS
jgi:hypothetical protein